MAISIRNLLPTELKTTALISAVRTAFLAIGIASTIFILTSISSSLPRIRTPSYLFITVHFIIILIWKLRDPVQNEEEFQYISKEIEIPDPIPPSLPDLLDSEQGPFNTEIDDSHNTIDATWKAIVEKGAAETEETTRPRMKKSDTWERCGRDLEKSSQERNKFRKCETFRRISMGREELYRLADAFITTQYAQRRIQRQECKQENVRMVNAAC